MKCEWLHHSGRPDLLVFFHGWGMDAKPLRHLTCDRWDVLLVCDYRTLALPPEWSDLWRPYGRCQVVAWSFGVWVALSQAASLPPDAELSLAVNGTAAPVHARWGIAPAIFESTLRDFSGASPERFYRNMFSDPVLAGRFLSLRPERDWTAQRDELACLQAAFAQRDLTEASPNFAAALVSERDSIILARNQFRYWRPRAACRPLPGGHFPFFLWRSWEEMLNLAVRD